jgi:GTP-binding protein Era
VLPEPIEAAPEGLDETGFRTGSIAIVGRPNVGKSTLLNRLVGQKVSITSSKAQTTRHRITGILTRADAQFIFVDTPGFQTEHKTALNRTMNRAVRVALADVDVVVFVVEAGHYGRADAQVAELLPRDRPVILAINKSELLKDRNELLPFLATRSAEHPYAGLVPLSARTGLQTDVLLDEIARHLPRQAAIFGPDDYTDRNERFLVAELIREKVFRLVGDELPYGSTVTIEKFEEEPALADPGGRFCRIYATILVDRPNHKAMIIGAGGAKLKQIGSDARADIERLLGAKAHLELWIKVRSGWADDQARLKSYGYE